IALSTIHYSYYRSVHPPDLPSFPTRRSSDLDFATSTSTPCKSFHAPALCNSRAYKRAVFSFDLIAHGCRVCSIELANSESCTCRSEEHTSELQSRENLVCRLLLE